MSIIENQLKCGWMKEVNFTIDQWNHGYKVMTEMYSAHTKWNHGYKVMTEMCSAHTKEISVIAEIFTRTLKK